MLQLYKNIKKKRLELGMSQEELAKMVGYSSRSMIAKIEAGNIDIYQSKIEEIAKALDTTSADLMGWDDAEVPTTIAAHLKTEDLTQDELDDVADYIEYIKNKRKK